LIIGGVFWYLNHTTLVAKKAAFNRSMVGQPTTINPLFAANEIDQSLSSLVYRGLLKSDGKGGIINDLADSYEKSEDGRHWVVHLKKMFFGTMVLLLQQTMWFLQLTLFRIPIPEALIEQRGKE